MSDLIKRESVLLGKIPYDTELTEYQSGWNDACDAIANNAPSAQPERPKDIIQHFHDYQVEWLKNHCDIELEPELEELIVRYLHDTADCFVMEME